MWLIFSHARRKSYRYDVRWLHCGVTYVAGFVLEYVITSSTGFGSHPRGRYFVKHLLFLGVIYIIILLLVTGYDDTVMNVPIFK